VLAQRALGKTILCRVPGKGAHGKELFLNHFLTPSLSRFSIFSKFAATYFGNILSNLLHNAYSKNYQN